jgi:hypothetical protein
MFNLFPHAGGTERDIGVAWSTTASTANTGSIKQIVAYGSNPISLEANVYKHTVTSLGNGFTGYYWTDSSAGNYYTIDAYKPRMVVRRIG